MRLAPPTDGFCYNAGEVAAPFGWWPPQVFLTTPRRQILLIILKVACAHLAYLLRCYPASASISCFYPGPKSCEDLIGIGMKTISLMDPAKKRT